MNEYYNFNGRKVFDRMILVSNKERETRDFDEIENYSLRNKKDSISFYFEVSEDNYKENEEYTIYRIHYNYDEYRNLIIGDTKNNIDSPKKDSINKVDIKATKFKVTSEQLHDLIRYFYYSHDDRTKLIKEAISNQSFALEQSNEEFIENLNLIFYRYYFDNKTRTFIFDETSDTIDSYYDNCIKKNNRVDLKDYRPGRYMEDIDDSHDYALRVYDVGQGNCSALIKYTDVDKNNYDVVMVFDFGLEYGKKNDSLDEMINKIDDNTKILISHFDMDHINNVINRTDLNTPWWIFPEYHGNGAKANKFFAVLLKVASAKTYLGDVPTYDGYLDLSSNIKVYQNKDKKDPNQSTKNNAECLVSTIITGRNNILIPADSLYEEYDDKILENKYNYILIPHHCCKYDLSKIRGPKKIDMIISDNTKGIALSGKNKYGHANNNHLKRYPKQLVFSSCKIYDDYKKNITGKSKLYGLLGDFFEIEL